MWTKETRALVNGIRRPHPADPAAVDLRRSSWNELRVWSPFVPPFEASAQLQERFARVTSSLTEEEPPSAPLDAQTELLRYSLLTDAWKIRRGTLKRNAKLGAMRLDELALLRRSLATFWASTDIECALSLLEERPLFVGSVRESGPTRYEVDVARGAPYVGRILVEDHIPDDGIWAGLRRVLFTLSEDEFARASAVMARRLRRMEDDPSCEASTLWMFRVGFAYAGARSSAAAHELADAYIETPRLLLECRRRDRLLAAMTDPARAQRLFGRFGVSPLSYGVSVWLDAAEGLGAAVIPILDGVIAGMAEEYSAEQMWCVHVASHALS